MRTSKPVPGDAFTAKGIVFVACLATEFRVRVVAEAWLMSVRVRLGVIKVGREILDEEEEEVEVERTVAQ